MNFLLRGPMLDPSESEAGTIFRKRRCRSRFGCSVWSRVHFFHSGAILAVLLALLVYLLLWRTTIGYRIRAVGLNPGGALCRDSSGALPDLSLVLQWRLCRIGGRC
ncbi:MAG: hypothetical protein R2867_06785 [Caldilineaceae bacterium]